MKIKRPGKILLILLSLANCIEPYPLPSSDGQNILVVDGLLNGTDGSCTVKLMRASDLASNAGPIMEPNAQIYILEENGPAFLLDEIEEGVYQVNGLVTSFEKKYTLKIITADRKEYESDKVQIKSTPEIDSITWTVEDNSAKFFVNTHDPEIKSRFYQWSFIETWEYTSVFESNTQYDPIDSIGVIRELDVYRCWRSAPSTTILVGSTAELSEPRISNFPLTSIASTSQKIGTRYSILVKQSALSEEAFNFWSALQKNTENLGSLFDPLPSKIVSNVKNTRDGSEPVLGFFSASTFTEKRFFIQKNEFPPRFLATERIPPGCVETYEALEKGVLKKFGAISDGYELTTGVYIGGGVLVGYNYTSPKCMDCTEQGGSLNKPDFW